MIHIIKRSKTKHRQYDICVTKIVTKCYKIKVHELNHIKNTFKNAIISIFKCIFSPFYMYIIFKNVFVS